MNMINSLVHHHVLKHNNLINNYAGMEEERLEMMVGARKVERATMTTNDL